MSVLSPLQVLPLHVAKLIVDHVVGCSRLVFDGIAINSDKYMGLLKPLLWSCHNLRAIAYARYCSHFYLALTSLEGTLSSALPRAGAHVYLGYPTHHLAKEAQVELFEEDIYSGKALQLLTSATYGSRAFPLARKIVFHIIITGGEGEEYETSEAEETGDSEQTDRVRLTTICKVGQSVSAFVQQIRQMAPMVSEISVLANDPNGPRDISSLYYSNVVSQLYRLATRIEYSYVDDISVPVELRLDEIRDLTHIKYASEASDDRIMQLARQNSQTLHYLAIFSKEGFDAAGLIRNTDGSCSTYPRLRMLKLDADYEFKGPQRSVFGGAIPFPNLKRLTICLLSPFDSHPFFRGNAAALEVLEMKLSIPMVSMFCQHNVFTLVSHPKLHCVNIKYAAGLIPDVFPTAMEYMRFVLSIGPGASVREIEEPPSDTKPITTLPLLGNYACIQVLSLPSTKLELWDVFALIKSLPLLSDLHTTPPSLGVLPAGVTQANLSVYVQATYSEIGGRFRCWHLKSYRFGNHTEIVKCVLLLALACPNLSYIVPSPGRREAFMRQMKNTIATKLFKPHEPRMKRLLLDSCNDR
ncbi:hypothetical protein GGI00_001635 [Coemansia sp. RSA 2681]|nr:hypothetical protein GGI00_001635 [Coemansia sp. RSA 2681]